MSPCLAPPRWSAEAESLGHRALLARTGHSSLWPPLASHAGTIGAGRFHLLSISAQALPLGASVSGPGNRLISYTLHTTMSLCNIASLHVQRFRPPCMCSRVNGLPGGTTSIKQKLQFQTVKHASYEPVCVLSPTHCAARFS